MLEERAETEAAVAEKSSRAAAAKAEAAARAATAKAEADAPGTQRALTLLPLLRNVVLITLAILVTLTVLSELGVDIGPLIAGAGIIGRRRRDQGSRVTDDFFLCVPYFSLFF